MKTATLYDFLTPAQIQQAIDLYEQGGRAAEIDQQLITPNLLEINRKLGQKNVARYLAYAVEFTLSQATDRQSREE